MIDGVDFLPVDRPVPSGARGSTPVRTCVGCRKRSASSELLRVVVAVDEDQVVLVPDPRHRAPGRGAHLHPRYECLDLAERRRAFPRALRVAGPLDLTALHVLIESEAG